MPKIYKELFTDLPEEEFESEEEEEEREEESEEEVAPVVVKSQRKRKVPKLLPVIPEIKEPLWIGKLFEEVAYIKKKINTKPKKYSPLTSTPTPTPEPKPVPAPAPAPAPEPVPVVLPQTTKPPKSKIFT